MNERTGYILAFFVAALLTFLILSLAPKSNMKVYNEVMVNNIYPVEDATSQDWEEYYCQ
jgi:hypothetical protein